MQPIARAWQAVARGASRGGAFGIARSRRPGRAVAVVVCLAAAWLGLAGGPAIAASRCRAHPWCNTRLAASQRATLLVAAMTAAEKLTLVSSGNRGIPELGIPPLIGIDGPNGIGEGNAHVTAFPDAETLAAAWSPSLARAYGTALGAEAAGKGFDWLFAPTVNIVRTPLWGREPETLGEDPFLAGSLAASEVQGIQSQHVISEVKHYVANDQEIDRFGQPIPSDAVSAAVSERALEEIDDPPFKAAVQHGHVGSVMCSYNRVNTLYSCQNPQTLATLRGFGLQGFVGPDAELAVRSDVTAVNAGVDNMQLGSLATATGASELAILTTAFDSGQISPARLDDATHRILTAMFRVGLFDHPTTGAPTSRVSTPAHLALATRVAEQATVLLRNRGEVLPLSPTVGSIAVIGEDAGAGTQIEENGSPAVRHGPVVTPLAGIRRVVGSRSRITYVPGTLGVVALPTIPSAALTPSSGTGHGLSARYYTGQTATGQPALTAIAPVVDFASKPAPLATIPGTPKANSGVFTGTLTPPRTGSSRFALNVSGDAQLYLNGRLVISANAEFSHANLPPGSFVTDPGAPRITFQGQAQLTENRPVSIRVVYATGSSLGGAQLQLGWEPPDPSLIAAAVRAARHAKVAVVFANDVSSEGMDRPSLELPGDQDRLITAVATANPRTVVVLHTAGPVLMPWLSKVAGVLEAWYPGQQSGTAIAATLFGRSDPSGHLPVTFPRTASQGPATQPAEYPGIDNVAQHSEGIFVGYRYYGEHHQTPLFPFGYGLSYTSFALSRLAVAAAGGGSYRATVKVTNTGRRSGTQVVQAYVRFPSSAGEPPLQLKAYARVSLQPGTSRTVQLALPRSSFEYFDSTTAAWTLAPGRYRLVVGSSSSDLPLSASVTPAPAFPGPGRYTHAQLSYHGDLYHYSLYVPASYHRWTRVPLVVMIHGCNTTADEQAAASEYDPIAERHHFVVLYPDVDAADVRHVRCWKGVWDPSGEGRDRGDAGAIAAMTHAVMGSQRIDPSRVYAAGMSSGAFEVSILGAVYPDLYAAIAIHSGAAYMRGQPGCLGAYRPGPSTRTLARRAFAAMGRHARVMPVILFHGDDDHIVPYLCGRQALAQWLATDNVALSQAHRATLASRPTQRADGRVPGGLAYTVSSYTRPSGCPVVQFWTIHGMHHYWSGGSPLSSSAPFTDPQGPSAAAASWAFLSAHTLTKPSSRAAPAC